MRRAAVGLALAAALAAWPASAPAASPAASCIGIAVSFEATQLERGFVGAEVSAAARSEPGAVGSFVSTLAGVHAGSLEACFAEAE